jgi:hypothetical protein
MNCVEHSFLPQRRFLNSNLERALFHYAGRQGREQALQPCSFVKDFQNGALQGQETVRRPRSSDSSESDWHSSRITLQCSKICLKAGTASGISFGPPHDLIRKVSNFSESAFQL